MSFLKKYLFVLGVLFVMMFAVCAQQEVAATELTATAATEAETEATTQDTDSAQTESTEPEIAEIPYEIVRNSETKAWEIKSENLLVSVINDRQLSVTVSGLEVQEEYLHHPYEWALSEECDFDAFMRVFSDGREFWIWSRPNLSFSIEPDSYESYMSMDFKISVTNYCRDHGYFPVPVEIPLRLEDMKSGLYTHKSDGYFYEVDEVEKIEHTQDSITWHVRIPIAYNFDVKKLDRIEISISGEESRHYVLSTEEK